MGNASDDTAPSTAKPKWHNLRQRVISSVVLAVAAAIVIGIGGWLYNIVIVVIGILMWREWWRMTSSWHYAWTAIGMVYIAIPCISFLYIRPLTFWEDNDWGLKMVVLLVGMVASSDIGAFFAGKFIGGPKLAPRISPNKTWAGFFGGIGGTCLFVLCCVLFFDMSLDWEAWPYILLFSLLAQAGDLFESWVKRRAGVKDSGALIPGHGGLLDRMDGYMFTAPLMMCLMGFA